MNAGVDVLAPLHTKIGNSEGGKEGRDEKSTRGTPTVLKFPIVDKDISVGTTVVVLMKVYPFKTIKVGHSSPQPSVFQYAMLRWKCPRAYLFRTSEDVSGPLSVPPNGVTTFAAKVDKSFVPGERRKRSPLYVSGVRNSKISLLNSREFR